MIKVRLKRFLGFGDEATKDMDIPYAPFIGLELATGVPHRMGIFTILIVRYDGIITRLSEEHEPFYPEQGYYEKPSDDKLRELQVKADNCRDEKIADYEKAGWNVTKSNERTWLNISWKE